MRQVRERRYKNLCLNELLAVDLLNNHRPDSPNFTLSRIDGLPEDYEVVCVTTDPWNRCLIITVFHESFDIVPDAERPPEFPCTYTRFAHELAFPVPKKKGFLFNEWSTGKGAFFDPGPLDPDSDATRAAIRKLSETFNRNIQRQVNEQMAALPLCGGGGGGSASVNPAADSAGGNGRPSAQFAGGAGGSGEPASSVNPGRGYIADGEIESGSFVRESPAGSGKVVAASRRDDARALDSLLDSFSTPLANSPEGVKVERQAEGQEPEPDAPKPIKFREFL